ncbi:hypothetical protein Taro_039601, partial [Colocasia esculenta]|nr:hypothetical protein [Colocasia esculenta]
MYSLAQAGLSTARPRKSCESDHKRELALLYLGSSEVASALRAPEGAVASAHVYTARSRSLRPFELLKARSLCHAYITARPRSLQPSELLKAWSLRHTRTQLDRGHFGTPLAKVRYSPPTLRHSARLATDLSVRVSPRRAHSAGFAGQVGTSGVASHIGQAHLKGIHRLGRLGSVWQEAPQ